jgi:hypothetical protein
LDFRISPALFLIVSLLNMAGERGRTVRTRREEKEREEWNRKKMRRELRGERRRGGEAESRKMHLSLSIHKTQGAGDLIGFVTAQGTATVINSLKKNLQHPFDCSGG